MRPGRVEIEERGRGGRIVYMEHDHRIAFDWEFALPPALALIWGPGAADWDAHHPWAAGRQREIYELVGEEVVRRRARQCHVTFDLAAGTMEVRYGDPAERMEVREILRRLPEPWRPLPEGEGFELQRLERLTTPERDRVVAALAAREITSREVEALAALNTPAAWREIAGALRHHLSIDTRLAAAEALKERNPTFDLESVLCRQLRELNDPRHGLTRALRLAEANPSPAVRQALLYASYNATECAGPCARLLLRLCGTATEPLEPALQEVIGRLGLHVSSFERQAGFEALCRRVGMELER